jgi:hypothetical protein
MCLICSGLDNKTLLPWEAEKNLSEFKQKIDKNHQKIVKNKILQAKKDYFDFFTDEESKFCDFCECDPCDCDWGYI